MPAFKYSIALIINRKSIVTVGTQRFFFAFLFFCCTEKIINNFFDYFSIEGTLYFLFDSQSTVLCLILKSLIYTKNFSFNGKPFSNDDSQFFMYWKLIFDCKIMFWNCAFEFCCFFSSIFHISAWTSTCAG